MRETVEFDFLSFFGTSLSVFPGNIAYIPTELFQGDTLGLSPGRGVVDVCVCFPLNIFAGEHRLR